MLLKTDIVSSSVKMVAVAMCDAWPVTRNTKGQVMSRIIMLLEKMPSDIGKRKWQLDGKHLGGGGM